MSEAEQELGSAGSAWGENVTQICHTLAENAQDSVDVSLQVWRESIDVS